MHRESVLATDERSGLLCRDLTTFQAALRVFEDHGPIGRSAISPTCSTIEPWSCGHRWPMPAVDSGGAPAACRTIISSAVALPPRVERSIAPRHLATGVSLYLSSRKSRSSFWPEDALDRLDRCLRRLLEQDRSIQDYEVLVVDCGSEVDDTLDLYAELEARQPAAVSG
ncbi:MAG: hypothetical protein V9G98_10895 [Candidatus Competibacter sp.]